MTAVNSVSHSVICVDDLHEAARFYCDVLGGEKRSAVCFETEDTLKGRSVHETYIVEDFVFFVALSEQPMPKPVENRGMQGFRNAFFVSKEKFADTIAALKRNNIPFEGPVDHPEKGPFGQSIYFKDPAGNFLECLWRRDEGSERFAKPYFLGIG